MDRMQIIEKDLTTWILHRTESRWLAAHSQKVD